MAATAPPLRPNSSRARDFLYTLIAVGAVLFILFHESFSPDKVLFNNDAPLGALSVQEEYAAGQFTGAWYNANWIGSRGISALPNLSSLFYLAAGAVGFSKFYPPFCFLLLGLSVWWFFRRLGFGPIACGLGALAAALNMNSFSNGCWGLPTRALSMATTFCALAFVSRTGGRWGWLNFLLAGAAVGIGLMEAYDVGAIYSIYVAAYVAWLSLMQEPAEPVGRRIFKGVGNVALVATFAAFVSAHALATLIATQIQGVSTSDPARQTAQQKWDAATQWSLPKIETLRVIIPGLFGYRMDTSGGGEYWGRVGQQPGWEQHHQGYPRHSGSGEYAGLLVVLVALWAILEAWRKTGSVFTPAERKLVRFWIGAAAVSLLLAFGRHAPFYRIIYAIPSLSFIRNPIKFMHPFHVALLALFGYGIHGITQRYLERQRAQKAAPGRSWWAAAAPFDRRWLLGLIAATGLAVLACLIFYSSRTDLQRHLETSGFTSAQAAAIAGFSFGEIGWFVLFLAAASGLFTLVVKGAFSEGRAVWAAVVFGLFIVADLSRANQPWILYYNYKEKYATNPIFELLRKDPFTHRVAAKVAPLGGGFLVNDARSILVPVCSEWQQHEFPYYKIQSLDIVQSPRTPEMDDAFMQNFHAPNQEHLYGRLWELTNTRYVLGMTGFLGLLNQQFDPLGHRFRVAYSFDIVPKPTVPEPKQVEDLMVSLAPNAQFSLFEFDGALPRAGLYPQWSIVSDLRATLAELASTNFNPQTRVLVHENLPAAPSAVTNTAPGTVTIQSYQPKEVILQADATAPSVLLLNDRFDENWKLTVDGAEQPLLRCNYIMRGAFLQPGRHTVTFRFAPPVRSLYVSLAGLLLAAIILAVSLRLSPGGKTALPDARP